MRPWSVVLVAALLAAGAPIGAQDAAPTRTLIWALSSGRTPLSSVVDPERGLVWITFTEGEGPGMRRAEHFCTGESELEGVRARLRQQIRIADRVTCRHDTCEIEIGGEYGVTQELHFRAGTRTLETVIERNSSYRSGRERRYVARHLSELSALRCTSP